MVSHPTLLRGPRFAGPGLPPLLLERLDPQFMKGVREQLLTTTGRAEVVKSEVPIAQGGFLRLYQPTHRVAHLAVLEALCLIPGLPRLAASKIESAGLVIRRVARRAGSEIAQAWMRAEDGLQGWIDLSDPAAPDADPDPARRVREKTGSPVLDRQLRALRASGPALQEVTAPLFVLPPAVCEAAGATLLYGPIPTSSLEAERAPPATRISGEELLEGDFPDHLRRAPRQAPPVPFAGQKLTRDRAADPHLARYLAFVQQVAIVYDLEGETPGAQRLRGALETIVLDFPNERAGSLLVHLRAAKAVLLAGGTGTVEMPLRWPSITEAEQAALLEGASAATAERFDRLGREAGRFLAPGARYRTRAFIRVRRDDGCPPDLIWSEPSAPYVIAPWYEAGPAPVTVIPLPSPAQGLAAFQPNVAFAVPSDVADVLRDNTPDMLIEGRGTAGTKLGIQWICAFSIPIVTLCAFLILNLFLSLLNIIFWWLPFVKICFPLPKVEESS